MSSASTNWQATWLGIMVQADALISYASSHSACRLLRKNEASCSTFLSACLLQVQLVHSRGTWPSWARAVHSPTASSAGTSVPPRRITLLTASMMCWLGQKRNAASACIAA